MNESQDYTADLRQQYAIKNQIDQAKETIIQTVGRFADQINITETGLTATQLNHLQRVALEAASVTEVLEWVEYHSRRGSPWGEPGVLEAVQEYIGKNKASSDAYSMYQMANRIGQDLQLAQTQIEQVWLQLTQHFAGYLRRRFTYLSRQTGSGK